MRSIMLFVGLCTSAFLLSSCSSFSDRSLQKSTMAAQSKPIAEKKPKPNYAARMPQHIETSGRKVILIDPGVHAWGAYGPDGNLIRGGLATAGSSWCADIKRSCRTKVGTFSIQSLGNFNCKSTRYPLPKGGAPMPYCMFFNGHQGLHGSYNVVDGNASHGCVRLHVADAEWLRFNFATIGTRVIVRPY
jgi:hypothetical protein